MIVFPNAKINIGLRIIRKRGDGYHDLESVFYPIGLSDVLEILPADSIINDTNAEISISGFKAPATANNICVKAARLMRERRGLPKVRIHLHKKIPMESGLGGGSSDASFTMLAMNEMFDGGLKKEDLQQFASEIGSDCPFFIQNIPTLVSGKGDIMEPINLSLKGYHLVVIVPKVSVSTREAYQLITPSELGHSLRDISHLKPEQWKGLISNQFEEPVFSKYPEIKEIKEYLYNSGAVYASMSGSGSSVFGIFTSEPSLLPELSHYWKFSEVLF